MADLTPDPTPDPTPDLTPGSTHKAGRKPLAGAGETGKMAPSRKALAGAGAGVLLVATGVVLALYFTGHLFRSTPPKCLDGLPTGAGDMTGPNIWDCHPCRRCSAKAKNDEDLECPHDENELETEFYCQWKDSGDSWVRGGKRSSPCAVPGSCPACPKWLEASHSDLQGRGEDLEDGVNYVSENCEVKSMTVIQYGETYMIAKHPSVVSDTVVLDRGSQALKSSEPIIVDAKLYPDFVWMGPSSGLGPFFIVLGKLNVTDITLTGAATGSSTKEEGSNQGYNGPRSAIHVGTGFEWSDEDGSVNSPDINSANFDTMEVPAEAIFIRSILTENMDNPVLCEDNDSSGTRTSDQGHTGGAVTVGPKGRALFSPPFRYTAYSLAID